MRRGVQVFIVAVVAIATNVGLRAAFWSQCGNGYCGPNNYNHHRHWQHGNCGNQTNNCANPWGCGTTNSAGSTDTIK